MRYGGAKKRRDLVEPAIIEALRAAGVLVRQVHSPGFCDLITWNKAKRWMVLLECKTAKGTLTPLQIRYTAEGWPIVLVRTVDEALHACKVEG